jgi:hypothetical protein
MVLLTGGRDEQRIDHYRTADAECRARPAKRPQEY